DLGLGDLLLGAVFRATLFAIVLGGELGLQGRLVLEGFRLGPAARAPLTLREQPHRWPSVMLVRPGGSAREVPVRPCHTVCRHPIRSRPLAARARVRTAGAGRRFAVVSGVGTILL